MQDRAKRWAGLFAVYLIAAWALHGLGQNLWVQLLGGGDSYTAGLPSKLFATSLSAWNPYVQLGQYTFANTQFQPFYPPGLILLGLLPNTLGYNLFLLSHYALAGFFFYLFARQLGLARSAAFFGGLAFLCCGFLTAHKGHQAMLSTAVWLPLLLLFAARHAASGEQREAVGAGVALALSWLAGFPQVTVYSLLFVVPYWFWRSEGGWRRPLGGIAVMSVLGFLLSSLQLLAVVEALPWMTRETLSFASFNQNSLPWPHLFGLFVPNLLGGMHGVPSYSKDAQLVEVFAYCGLAPLVLAGLARGREARFWLLVLLTAGALSLGWEPIQRLLFHVPVYNLFRAAGRYRLELHLALSVLAALGFARLAERRGPWPIAVALGIAAATALAFVVPIYESINVVVSGFSAAHWRTVNTHWLHPTLLFPALSLLATAAAWWWRAPVAVWAVLLIVDVGSVSRTIYANPNTTALYGRERRSEIRYLFERGFDATHERILPIDPFLYQTYPLQNMMYHLSTVNDMTPMWMKRYQALTGFDLNGSGGEFLVAKRELLSALGVRFVLTKMPDSVAAVRRAGGYRELAATRDGITVFENPGALPRFRFVAEAVPVADFAAAKALWERPGAFDPRRQAMVEGAARPEMLAPGHIVRERIGMTALDWDVTTDGRALFVVADTWFPGWKATVDGVEAPIVIVNGCLRGVYIDRAGAHTITMRFWPWSLTAGLGLTALGLLLAASSCRRSVAKRP